MSLVAKTISPVAQPKSIAERVSSIVWEQVPQDLDAQGSAMLLSPDLVIPCTPFTVPEGMDIQNQTRFTYKNLRAVKAYEQLRIAGAKRSTPQPLSKRK